ncbi:type III-B CRISPR module-associated protein Cmr5 [uncultured Cohaesibacter sp.]|uniref:type III-B CRISPR module-associated protein Cmr5 n=1 Tax=uncultured Cohaesibacter sp. TaxID=1002546 RepID=UPI002AA6E98D|nr:type III-B CRISPR module-associated protein Cmr5 [uncultured Cohaesibacter sp.]
MAQTLAQKRAKHALAQILALVELEEQKKGNKPNAHGCGNYLAFVKSLPATIILSGLGQAMAMEKAGSSKDGDVGLGHEYLYAHMNDWLCGNGNGSWQHSCYKDKTDILDAITSGDERDYVKAQIEAIEYLEWLKKFAVAHLINDKKGT